MKEKDIENLILQWLNNAGFFAWKNQSVGIYDATRKRYRKPNNKWHINGVSDILGILPDGKFLAIEVKTAKTKNRVSCAQKDYLQAIDSNGGVAIVAWSLDCVLEAFIRLNYIPDNNSLKKEDIPW
jgi:hypothetical protein